MSIAIVACPKCNTLLLNDTVQCHRCRHFLRPEQAGHFRDSTLPTDAAVQEDLDTCKQCGETYRKGLVRCWSCGAFTRPEIEESYYRLLRGHARSLTLADQHHELREISAEEARASYQLDDEKSRNQPSRPQPSEVAALDEDFELAGDISLRDEESFPPLLAPETAPETADDPQDMFGEIKMPDGTQVSESTESENGSLAPEDDQPPPVDEAKTLLDIAKQEETDTQKARKARTSAGSFVVFCPMGCKIRVQERHRGKVGHCPKCQATFMVPMARQTSLSGSIPPESGEGARPATNSDAAAHPSKYPHWIENVHLHRVAPQKLRIKADSLLNEFLAIDVGFDPAGLLLVAYPKAGGMFGGKKVKKIDESRAAVKEHLATKPTLEGLPAAFQQELTRDALAQMSLTQPAPPGSESLFGDIPVFGTGRIAVRLPKFDDKTVAYLSFSLSQFREFSRLVGDVLEIGAFGVGCGIPLQDEYQTAYCQVSQAGVKELQRLDYYQKDPTFPLEVAGYRCKVCSAVISESARAAQNLGGANGKAIAKAKCPKCTKPLGNQPLYLLASSGAASPAVEPPPAGEESESAAPALD